MRFAVRMPRVPAAPPHLRADAPRYATAPTMTIDSGGSACVAIALADARPPSIPNDRPVARRPAAGRSDSSARQVQNAAIADQHSIGICSRAAATAGTTQISPPRSASASGR